MEKENKIFVVSWAEYDRDTDNLTSGTFAFIYSSLEKARKAVMDVIRDTVRDDTDCYEKSHWKSVYGTTNFDRIVNKFIEKDEGQFILVSNPNMDIVTHYNITCYDANLVA